MQSPTSTAPNRFLPITFNNAVSCLFLFHRLYHQSRCGPFCTSFTLRRRISTKVMKRSCIGLVVPVDYNLMFDDMQRQIMINWISRGWMQMDNRSSHVLCWIGFVCDVYVMIYLPRRTPKETRTAKVAKSAAIILWRAGYILFTSPSSSNMFSTAFFKSSMSLLSSTLLW